MICEPSRITKKSSVQA